MRLPGDRAFETIAAAAEAGITVFDTARAYEGNESLLATALRRCGAETTARIVTKGGMTRPDGAWVPDGRAKSIVADCESSLEALGGLPIDLYLLHAPDPRTTWRTSLRALTRLVDESLVKRVGVCNVNRTQLDEALDHAPIAAVQVALSVFDDRALRGGVLERCEDAGIALMAHSPLGGVRRAASLRRREALTELASARDSTPAEIALAWLLALSPSVVAIPGARHRDTARSSARAASLQLGTDELSALAAVLGGARAEPSAPASGDEVVVVMGIPGAGKSRVADDFVARGYARLNRDERGGSLRDIANALDDELRAGAGPVVLDNTYLTRAARNHVIEIGRRHGRPARCVWLDTPLAQAQVNMVERLLDRFGSLPSPEELKAVARREPGLHTPTTQMRTVRELEPPSEDEGWDSVERVPFVREEGSGVPGVFVAAAAVERYTPDDPAAPHLIFDWRPDDADADPGRPPAVTGSVEVAVCPHGGGPPVCWCRPPLPGLPLAFARTHGVDPARSTVVGCRPAHRTLAEALGSRYVDV